MLYIQILEIVAVASLSPSAAEITITLTSAKAQWKLSISQNRPIDNVNVYRYISVSRTPRDPALMIISFPCKNNLFDPITITTTNYYCKYEGF